MGGERGDRWPLKILIWIAALLLAGWLAWQVLVPPICGGCDGGMKYLYPAPLPTPDASTCTTEWNKIDRSLLGQRVCVRGNLHAVDSFDSFFGAGTHILYLLRPIGSKPLHEGDCVMAGGIVMSDATHPLYIRPDSIGLCSLQLPAWWP